MVKKILWLAGITVLVPALFFAGCRDKDANPIQSQTRFLMDTYCTIQVPGDFDVLEAIGKAFDRIEEIDVKFNSLNPESPLYNFNNNNVPIDDEEIVALVQKGLEISEISEGNFDITVFPLVELWGFYGESPALPKQEDISNLLKATGHRNLVVENGQLIKTKEETKIDLGSIAKGYAIGEAKKALEQCGITSGLIDAGGDIYALGTNYGKPWVIGIRNPRGDGVIGALELSDMAVITSGDYERVFEENGEKYHHILDPGTGYPAKGMASVTVISPDPALADAWSTAFFVLGKEKNLEIINDLQSVEIFMITTDGEKINSSGMQIETQYLD